MAETGRPPFPIDWDVVDKLLQVHCTGTECASNLGVHAQTLYHACEREKGMSFTNYALKMREKGNTILRAAQANKAANAQAAAAAYSGYDVSLRGPKL